MGIPGFSRTSGSGSGLGVFSKNRVRIFEKISISIKNNFRPFCKRFNDLAFSGFCLTYRILLPKITPLSCEILFGISQKMAPVSSFNFVDHIYELKNEGDENAHRCHVLGCGIDYFAGHVFIAKNGNGESEWCNFKHLN